MFDWHNNNKKQKTLPDGSLSSGLKSGIERKTGSRFDDTMSGIVTSLIDRMIVPWILYCIRKYSEADFHTRLSGWFCGPHNQIHPQYPEMWDEGCMPFTFIGDMHRNHKTQYAAILKSAGVLKKFYTFNVPVTHQVIVDELRNVGWTIQEHESDQILKELYQLRNMILYGRYEI